MTASATDGARAGVDGARLRTAMGHFATGVTIVTALADADQPVGGTANAVTSVSLEPPLVLVCLRRGSRTLEAVIRRRGFALNILGHADAALARSFGVSAATDRFAGVPWRAGHAGAPLLDDAVATLECTLHHIADGGDHAVVLGRVTRLRHPESPAEPLVFFGGRFRRLSPTTHGPI